MVTPEIINYIRQQITSGISREQISASLKQNGWNDLDLTEAFKAINSSTNVIPQAPHIAQSHTTRNFIISVITLILLGGGGWYFFQKKSNPSVQNEVQVPRTNNFDDLKISFVSVPEEENSASIFNAIPSTAVAKEDKDLFAKYFPSAGFLPMNSIPLAESKKILAKYKDILASFESGVNKKYYQCSLRININCPLTILRDISKLAVLNSFVLSKEGKAQEAEQYTQKTIKLGQMITSQNSDLITFLVGLVMQKMGYYALHEVKPVAGISVAEKSVLINNFREDHKKAFRFEYYQKMDFVDYITDSSKKPSWAVDPVVEESVNIYRASANSITWKPEEVKKWVFDSLKIELSNIDLPCGSEYKDSVIDIGFDPKDTSKKENFLGKTFYSSSSVSLSTVNTKRCEVENLINAL